MYEKKGKAKQEGLHCVQLGTAEVNLHQIIDLQKDLGHEELIVRDRYENEIGTLIVSITALEALQEVLVAFGNLKSD